MTITHTQCQAVALFASQPHDKTALAYPPETINQGFLVRVAPTVQQAF